MRIIAGRFRSRKLHTPKDASTTRPIPDRVKESVFSILRGNCEGAVVLDAFAGTGAIGLEALSRGAQRVVMVERDRRIFELLRRNVEELGVDDECELVLGDALGPAGLSRCPRPVDLIFMDPPYPLILEPLGWERCVRQCARLVELLSDTGFLVLRTPWPFRHVAVLDDSGRPLAGPERARFDAYGRPRPENPRGERRGKGRRDRRDHPDEEREWVGGDLDAQAIQEESDEELAELSEQEQDAVDAGPGFSVRRADVALTIDGADGPETHTYTSQAVHLYMRRK